mgnify:CR=1 FL=1
MAALRRKQAPAAELPGPPCRSDRQRDDSAVFPGPGFAASPGFAINDAQRQRDERHPRAEALKGFGGRSRAGGGPTMKTAIHTGPSIPSALPARVLCRFHAFQKKSRKGIRDAEAHRDRCHQGATEGGGCSLPRELEKGRKADNPKKVTAKLAAMFAIMPRFSTTGRRLLKAKLVRDRAIIKRRKLTRIGCHSRSQAAGHACIWLPVASENSQ